MPDAADTDEAEARRIEAGRLFFRKPWGFLRGAGTIAALPPPDGVEVALAGRSNVGKSSLINALVGQKALARTSNTPGRTQELNFFGADAGVTLVDMPGYGYAQAPKGQVAEWTKLVFDFLRGRQNLRRVYVLIDARHGLKANDLEALDLLDKAAVSYQVVLTKADKIKPGALATLIATTAEAIRKRPAAHPVVLATSSETGAGLDALRAEIADLRIG
ncbi:MAG: YihA family ribosome biogenesis GTP-binding protein [Rhizobiales bacterium]|nr:YihA family ribosome biogenesis GTP-binding protein [Hyphomicrobiales bacterium]MBN9010111.1 YihA family ribosome biogenesis GTP-binding protein [Hyphomicrobiales bacterium]